MTARIFHYDGSVEQMSDATFYERIFGQNGEKLRV